VLEVLLYGMLEVALPLDLAVDNPYDPQEVAVEVEVARPDGSTQSWPAYYDGQGWSWRFRPTQPGEHAATILVDGEDAGSLEFEATPSDLAGPIHPDGWGFRHADGSPFVPLGLNLGWSAGGGSDDYDRWFGLLAEHGGSFARIWFTHFTDQDPEWDQLGTMDPDAAANMDTILDLAQAHGIAIMPVLWQHSELEASMWSSWEGNPYNAANGGPCDDSTCFFTDTLALEYQQRFLRYSVARWGAHPALAAWEIMNEIDGVTGVEQELSAPWAATHAASIRQLESDLHPVSWSYGLPAQAVPDQDWEGADFTQLHSYLLSDVTPVSEGVTALLEGPGGPVLVGEWGLDWFGNGDLEDSEGLAWHNASWAALASGSAGNALTWWWDNHVEPDELWWRLEGQAAVVAQVDLPAMAPVPASCSDDDLQVFARSDGQQTLVWVHHPEHTPPEPDEELVEGASLELDGAPVSIQVIDTLTGQGLGSGTACDGVVELPAFSGDLALLLQSEGFSCDEPEQRRCGCQAGRRAAGGGLLGLLLAAGLRRRRECSG